MPPDPEHQPQAALADLRSWDELERLVSAGAKRAGKSKAAALRDLRRKGPAVRALCAHLGVEVPPDRKPGRKPKPWLDDWIPRYKEYGETKLSLRGDELWEWVTQHVAKEDSMVGENLGVTPAAVKKRYYRLKKKQAE